MFFNSVKKINRLRKEVNRLLGKGMSNIYIKVIIEIFSKLLSSGSKNLSPGQFLESSNSCRNRWSLKRLAAT